VCLGLVCAVGIDFDCAAPYYYGTEAFDLAGRVGDRPGGVSRRLCSTGKEPGSIYLEQVVVCLLQIPCGRKWQAVLNGPEAHRSRKPALTGTEPFVSASCRDSQGAFVMKKFSKKSVLLFAAAMALCAFAMPSMASASSWGVVGSEHTLDGTLGFVNDGQGVSSDCARVQVTVDVTSTAAIEITGATFSGCTATGAAVGTCTVTSTGTNFPWTATARTTSDIQIHGVNIDVFFENHPGSAACGAAGVPLRITGTLTGARWTGNVTHEIDFPSGTGGASGLFSHSALGNGSAITVTGTLSDTQQTLTVTN